TNPTLKVSTMGTRWAEGSGREWWRASPVLGVVLGAAISLVGTARAGDKPSASSLRKASAPIPQVASIDRAIAEAWTKAGVKPVARERDDEFLRRAYLDLLGRIPSVPEARAFLAMRESGKREKLIEHLLNHADYAKNFATEWTILLIGRGNQGR